MQDEKPVSELSDIELYRHFRARTGTEFSLAMLNLIFPHWKDREREIIKAERRR